MERFMHLYAMNQGILLTPFHNMALMSPQTEKITWTGIRKFSRSPERVTAN